MALQKEGYVLSRQVLYHRLIPRRAESQEAKPHARTFPVKLRKAKITLRNSHADAGFAFAIKRQMLDIVFLFGSDNVYLFCRQMTKQKYLLALLLLQTKLLS